MRVFGCCASPPPRSFSGPPQREPVRQALTAEEWDAAFAEGERMTLAEAIQLALSIVPGRARP